MCTDRTVNDAVLSASSIHAYHSDKRHAAQLHVHYSPPLSVSCYASETITQRNALCAAPYYCATSDTFVHIQMKHASNSRIAQASDSVRWYMHPACAVRQDTRAYALQQRSVNPLLYGVHLYASGLMCAGVRHRATASFQAPYCSIISSYPHSSHCSDPAAGCCTSCFRSDWRILNRSET
jgi:hypothetical protein